jgi:hypothetical protein
VEVLHAVKRFTLAGLEGPHLAELLRGDAAGVFDSSWLGIVAWDRLLQ